jgi:hypothetical protein
MSASICSFAVAAAATLLGFPLSALARQLRAGRDEHPASAG